MRPMHECVRFGTPLTAHFDHGVAVRQEVVDRNLRFERAYLFFRKRKPMYTPSTVRKTPRPRTAF